MYNCHKRVNMLTMHANITYTADSLLNARNEYREKQPSWILNSCFYLSDSFELYEVVRKN